QRWSDVPSGQPLFESLIVNETFPFDAFDATAGDRASHAASTLTLGYTPQEITGPTYKTNFPLLLTVRPHDELLLRFTYDTGRVREATAGRLGSQVAHLLEMFTRAPETRVADLPLLTDLEREAVLVRSAASDTPSASSPPPLLHDRVADHARRTPD